MKHTLTKSTLIGILWTGISQFSTQIFRFIVNVILARLLYPEEFGIVGLATIFLGFISTINELGLSAAIIQRKKLDETHLSTSFWASLGMGTMLCIISILVSPFIADFFQEKLVRWLIVVISVGLILGPLSVVQRTLFEKNLNFKKITIAEICDTLVSGLISIFLAMNGYGVWSLVYGGLSGNFISVFILWGLSSWRPSLKFSFAHFKELFGFGSHVMGSRVLNYIDSNTDYLVIGKLLGTSALGYYTLAYNLITFPLFKISLLVTRVTFPAFSIIQDDNKTLQKGYLKVVRYISLITFPMLAGMFVVAPEFVVVIYGSKWMPMILPLQVLCLAGALKSVGTTVGTILLSKGRADIQFKWNILTAIVLTIAVIIGANYGIVGVAAAVTIVESFLFLIVQKITNKLIDLSMYNYLKAIYPAIIGSITLIIGVEIYQRIMVIYHVHDIGMLISSSSVGIIIYLLFIRLLFKNLFDEMKSLLHEMRN